MATKTATPRQAEILKWIKAFTAERGYGPSFREIGKQFRIVSTNGVGVQIGALEKKGLLKRPRDTHSGRAVHRAYQFPLTTDH